MIQLLFIDLVGLAHFRLVGWFNKLLQRLTLQKRLWAWSLDALFYSLFLCERLIMLNGMREAFMKLFKCKTGLYVLEKAKNDVV